MIGLPEPVSAAVSAAGDVGHGDGANANSQWDCLPWPPGNAGVFVEVLRSKLVDLAELETAEAREVPFRELVGRALIGASHGHGLGGGDARCRHGRS